MASELRLSEAGLRGAERPFLVVVFFWVSVEGRFLLGCWKVLGGFVPRMICNSIFCLQERMLVTSYILFLTGLWCLSFFQRCHVVGRHVAGLLSGFKCSICQLLL